MADTSVRERLFVRLDGDPQSGPESTVPASTLRGFSVPAGLQSAVAHATSYEERFPEGAGTIERVLPDGASRLLIHLHDSTATIHVAGASASPVLLRMRGHMHGLSVTLRPGASLELFGVPAEELSGRTVPWESLVRSSHRDLPTRVAEAPHDAARLARIFDALRTLRRPSDPTARRVVQHALDAVSRDTARLNARALAADLRLSERRVQQLFAAHLGLTPNAWRRLQRLHRTLRLLRATGSPRWSHLALEAGYYDQAHLINEFRALCGLTPGQFRRGVSDSSNP